ncbi:MAG: DUF1127 domain-containing protein [Alphaproteobacteria bacterium]
MRKTAPIIIFTNVSLGSSCRAVCVALSRGIGFRLARISRTLPAIRERAAQRHRLSKLDQRLLADIGVTRNAAQRESAKPAWRA